MGIEENKLAVTAFLEAMNRGDTEALLDAYAEDGYLWTMGNTLISGKYDKVQIRAFADGVFEAFPEGLSFRVISMTAEEDRVAVEAVSDGEHSSGVNYNNHYHFLFTLRHGKVASLKEYLDTEKVTDVLCAGQRPA
ncbi:MAG: nuclear transport factor 2 family protein [Halieaceae bacterium]|nr:nuclear transport factor 2 family protein [Halieaceae bacterium]